MVDYKNIFTSAINKVKREGRYRNFLNISKYSGNFPYAFNHVQGEDINVWCSNDYLGMSQNKKLLSSLPRNC